MQCYRKVSCVMCFRRSVLLRGRALEEKGLQLGSCCQAVKMRMTGSTSCYRRRTYLHNPGYSHRGDLRTGLQQRAAQVAGQASVDGGQVTVGSAC